MTTAERLYEEALLLTSEERADLGERILATVQMPPEVEAAWADEIARRLGELESGAVESIPWEVVRAKAFKFAGRESPSLLDASGSGRTP